MRWQPPDADSKITNNHPRKHEPLALYLCLSSLASRSVHFLKPGKSIFPSPTPCIIFPIAFSECLSHWIGVASIGRNLNLAYFNCFFLAQMFWGTIIIVIIKQRLCSHNPRLLSPRFTTYCLYLWEDFVISLSLGLLVSKMGIILVKNLQECFNN